MFYESYHLDKELIFKRKMSIFQEHELHTHELLEISILQEHDARYKLMNREYIGKPGDVFIFRPFEPHWPLVIEDHKPFKWIMVLFSPFVARLIPNGYRWLTPFYTDQNVSPLIPAKSIYAQAIQHAAEAAMQEKEQGHTGWEAKQFMYFIDILINIYRHMEQDMNSRECNVTSDQMLQTLEYILQHFDEELDSRQLIGISGLTKTKFYQQFKQLTGVSPGQFISVLRLHYASHLLRNTNDKITDIALESGFVSLSNFNLRFRQLYNVSPREFRQRHGLQLE